MADSKYDNYTVTPELKRDTRLREVFIRLGVLSENEIAAEKQKLEDLESNVMRVPLEKVMTRQNY